MPPPPDVLVEITALAPGGDAVGRQRGGTDDGRVTFVPYAAPGELVRARVTRARARVAWADLTAVERPSPERVTPPCPLFGRCGGCQWQHVAAPAQRREKGTTVSRALGRDVDLGPAAAVGPDYGYRDRARLAVGFDETGAPAIGFRAWRSHSIVDVPACPLLSPAAAAALPLLRQAVHDLALAPGDEVHLQAGHHPTATATAPTETVLARVGATLVHVDLRGPTPSLRPADPTASPALVDVAEPGGRPLLIPPGAFAQVGRAANAALVSALADALGPTPGRVLELHAGSGNFTRLLATRATDLIASEGDPAAVARGRHNVPEARWMAATALGPAPAPAPDTVVADPPREGLDQAALALASQARRRLVYVSCDPQTLSRDARRLAQAGLHLAGARALDLMPQTHHVEVVAVFDRSPPSPA